MLVISLQLMSLYISGISSIECFSCYVKPKPRSPNSPAVEFEPLCSNFDGSEQFLVNCTHSTFCMTRTFQLHHRQEVDYGSNSVVIVERGCAKQAYEHQALVRGKWRTIVTIMEDIYTPGCLSDKEWAGDLSSNTEYCYCDKDRCNYKMASGDENTTVIDTSPENLVSYGSFMQTDNQTMDYSSGSRLHLKSFGILLSFTIPLVKL